MTVNRMEKTKLLWPQNRSWLGLLGPSLHGAFFLVLLLSVWSNGTRPTWGHVKNANPQVLPRVSDSGSV